eukprot:COSAG01_NODE_959_length_12451_cov_18.389815_21_plen_77_part_00
MCERERRRAGSVCCGDDEAKPVAATFEQVARWPCTAVNRTVTGDGTPWAALYASSLSQQQPSTQQAQVAAGGQTVT